MNILKAKNILKTSHSLHPLQESIASAFGSIADDFTRYVLRLKSDLIEINNVTT